MFIQVIQGRCRDADRMHELSDEWRDTIGRDAPGWLGGTYGITDDGTFVAVVRFASREDAARNSARPEQGEWWSRMEACFEGETTFHDCDDVTLFLGGGSDDAGFVQVIQGRVEDPTGLRDLMSQPMESLHTARPEILGGTFAWGEDGWFTETISFRDEASAREGETQEMPPEIQERFQKEMAAVRDLTYLDLHQPWFTSART